MCFDVCVFCVYGLGGLFISSHNSLPSEQGIMIAVDAAALVFACEVILPDLFNSKIAFIGKKGFLELLFSPALNALFAISNSCFIWFG